MTTTLSLGGLVVPFHQMLLQRTENRPNRLFPGGSADRITVHMTGNRKTGADAANHAAWHYNSAPYSWHSSVDDFEIWQQLLWIEQGYHAGDGGGQGNLESIGVEICMNEGIDQEKAYKNAALLVGWLRRQGHGKQGVVQHNYWTGKDCPEIIRHTPGRWDRFLEQVRFFEHWGETPEEDPMALTEAEVRRIARQEAEAFVAGSFRTYLNLAVNGGPGAFSDPLGNPLPLVRDEALLVVVADMDTRLREIHSGAVAPGTRFTAEVT